MASDDLGARLRATFLQELDEQVRELNAGLLALEQGRGDDDTVRGLFRSAHTIKGAASVAGVSVIEEACHALESVFADVRDTSRQLEGADFSLLFAVLDGLADAGARIRADGDPAAGSLGPLLPRLARLARHNVGGAQTGAGGEAPSGAGVADASSRPAAAPVADASSRPAAALVADASSRPAAAPVADASSKPAAAPAADARAGDLVRVRADRLDALLSAAGELVIATGRIMERHGHRDEDARRLDRVTDNLADVVRALRLRPFADACEALPRAARDVAAAAGRQVELQLEGQDVEADRIVVDALREPLLHLVRNAVDHGIEDPAERERRGKPPAGTVRVAAALEAGRLTVRVTDDGAGFDEDAVRSALRARGRPIPARRGGLAAALLHGGLSTRREASTISGRGVGLDLVRASVERIGGTVDVQWRAGAGTEFTLECPPSPASIRALLVRVGPHALAIPTIHVHRLRRIRPADLRQAEGRSVLPTRAGPVPVHSLAALLGPPFEARPATDAMTLVIVSAGSRTAALVVDEAVDEDEIVVRPVDADRAAVPLTAGAAILPSGRIALVLGVGALLAAAEHAGTTIAPDPRDGAAPPRRRVLVADDSITTRTLEQSVLEAAGFDVITAVDGADAWRRLDEDGADVVVADVEMPRMDGFALCRRIRSSARFASLPIVLVTGLESEADRARGLEAGADAYIVKSNFDQAALIEVVQQLVGDG
jgi:two-component system, chemotaxis family, sensor kinase CheA